MFKNCSNIHFLFALIQKGAKMNFKQVLNLYRILKLLVLNIKEVSR